MVTKKNLIFPMIIYLQFPFQISYGGFTHFTLLQACKIVEGQRYTKRLNEKQITALLKVTCQRPRDRENDILQVSLLKI